MMVSFPVKQNDDGVLLRVQLAEGVSLVGKDVDFALYHAPGKDLKFVKAALVESESDRIVQYEFEAADLDQVGVKYGEFKVRGSRETFPDDGYIEVIVSPSTDQVPA